MLAMYVFCKPFVSVKQFCPMLPDNVRSTALFEGVQGSPDGHSHKNSEKMTIKIKVKMEYGALVER
jgi:hypothetical protein